MHHRQVIFSTDTEEYALWLWKWDYWNLHSGAEMGLYESPVSYSGTDHYDAIDFEVPMTLSLYNYSGAGSIDNIFNWTPKEEQWWITGFSGQNPDFMEPNRDLMATVGTVDLSKCTTLYEALQNKYNSNKSGYLEANLELIFDDDKHMVWTNWYEGVMQ